MMEKMLPHLGFIQPSSFHMLSQLARPVPLSIGQQLSALPALASLNPNHPLKLGNPLGLFGRDGFLDSDPGRPLGSPYDDDRGECIFIDL